MNNTTNNQTTQKYPYYVHAQDTNKSYSELIFAHNSKDAWKEFLEITKKASKDDFIGTIQVIKLLIEYKNNKLYE